MVGDHWGVSPGCTEAFMGHLNAFFGKNIHHKGVTFHVYYAFEWTSWKNVNCFIAKGFYNPS